MTRKKDGKKKVEDSSKADGKNAVDQPSADKPQSEKCDNPGRLISSPNQARTHICRDCRMGKTPEGSKTSGPGGEDDLRQKRINKRRSIIIWMLEICLISYFFLWSKPAAELGIYLVESNVKLGLSVYCSWRNPICQEDADLLEVSTRPQFHDLFKSTSLKMCPEACGKQVITWCDPDPRIQYPDARMIVHLLSNVIKHGAKRIADVTLYGTVWFIGFITYSVLQSLMLLISVLIFILMMKKVSKFALSLSSTFSKRKGTSKRNQSATKSRTGGGTSSCSSDSILSIFDGIFDAIDDISGENLTSGCDMSSNAVNLCTLNDYKGATKAKEELQLVIDFLKNPTKYHDFGARLPRGVLLYGPPGTGKTLFARTLAGEAKIAFIHKCASEFRSMFVGSGAKNIKALFAAARQYAPCIIFIDEIDSISKRTSSSLHPYANQAINQLLFEMDGFLQNDSDVVVIGATNRLDNIDPALLRPGRFDTIVRVDLPDLDSRKEILEHYVQRLKKVGNVDLAVIAAKTDEYSGAELEYLVNSAALIAASQNAENVEQKHLEEAVGKRKKSLEEIKEFDSENYKPSSRHAIAHMYN